MKRNSCWIERATPIVPGLALLAVAVVIFVFFPQQIGPAQAQPDALVAAKSLVQDAPKTPTPGPAGQPRGFFTTGATDALMGMASRPGPGPGSGENQETETGDDFILASTTSLTESTFTGLLPIRAPLSSIQQVVVEIYRVFPKDSNATRTLRVPTRTNSPSDVAFATRDSADGSLSFTAVLQEQSFVVANGVDTGIRPVPNQTTGGTFIPPSDVVRVTARFSPPFILPADHYFFVPQVRLSSGHWFWLSAPGPPRFPGDQQTWIRNADLAPDWLRVGADIVGGTPSRTFNATFALTGIPLLGDVNGDGVVNVSDLALFAQDFGQAGTNLRGDLNRDGVVNATDLAIFAQNFGLSGP